MSVTHLCALKGKVDALVLAEHVITFTADGKYLVTAYNRPLLLDVEKGQNLTLGAGEGKKTPGKIEQQSGRLTLSLGTLEDDDAITGSVAKNILAAISSGPEGVVLGAGVFTAGSFVNPCL